MNPLDPNKQNLSSKASDKSNVQDSALSRSVAETANQKIPSNLEASDVSLASKNVTIQERNSYIADLVQGIVNQGEREAVSAVIQAIPEENLSMHGVRFIANAFNKTMFFRYEDLQNIFRAIPKEETEECYRLVEPFLERVRFDEIGAILSSVTDLPRNEREEIVRLSEPFIKEEKSGREIAEFFRFIENVKKEKRPEIVQLAGPLLQGVFSCRSDYLKAIIKIPKSEREGLIRSTESMLKAIPNGRSRGWVVDAVLRIPENQREDVITQVNLFFEGFEQGKTPHELVRVFDLLRSIPEDQRKGVIKETLSFFGESVPTEYRAKVLLGFFKVPKEDRSSEVAESIYLLFLDAEHVTSENFNSISEEQRADVIKQASRILRNGLIRSAFGIKDPFYTQYGKSNLLQVLTKIPKNQRSGLIERAGNCLTGIVADPFGSDHDDSIRILEILEKIPESEREEFVDQTSRFFTNIKSVAIRCRVLEAASMMSRESAASVLAPLDFESLEWKQNLSYVFLNHEELGKASRDYLIGKLEDTIPSREEFQNKLRRIEYLHECVEPLEEEYLVRCIETAALYSVDFLPEESFKSGKKQPDFFWFSEPEEALKKQPVESFHFSHSLYRKLFDKAEEKDRPFVLQWIGLCEMGTRLLHMPPEIIRNNEDLFAQIARLRPPSLRFKMTRLALTTPSSLLGSFKKERPFMKSYRLTMTLLQERYQLGPDVFKEIEEVLNLDEYKDAAGKKIVLGAFTALLETPLLTGEDVEKLLGVIFPKEAVNALMTLKERSKNMAEDIKKERKNKVKLQELQESQTELLKEIKVFGKSLIEAVNKNLALTDSIGIIDSFERLKEVRKSEDFDTIFQALFKKVFGISEIESFSEKYLNTFGSFRRPESVFIYAGALKKLPDHEKYSVLGALKTYVEEVLEGNFPTARYEEASSVHLTTVFRDRPGLKERWIEGENGENAVDFNQIAPHEGESTIQAFDAKAFLLQSIGDNHIAKEKIPYLVQMLEGGSNPEELDRASLLKLIHLRQFPERHENIKEQSLLLLQRGLIRLLQAPEAERSEIFQKEVKSFIETACPDFPQFGQDVKDLGKALVPHEQEAAYEDWQVVDSDDAQDLLMCGTDVMGSCQNVASAETNKCLVGYLLDGKNRLIAVKNGKGEIVARCVFRILWDNTLQTPVLFQERSYYKPPKNERVLNALDRMCMRRAEALNLPLIANAEGDVYPNKLSSLGSRAPFEYVDSGRNGFTQGVFTVEGSLLFSPDSS